MSRAPLYMVSPRLADCQWQPTISSNINDVLHTMSRLASGRTQQSVGREQAIEVAPNGHRSSHIFVTHHRTKHRIDNALQLAPGTSQSAQMDTITLPTSDIPLQTRPPSPSLLVPFTSTMPSGDRIADDNSNSSIDDPGEPALPPTLTKLGLQSPARPRDLSRSSSGWRPSMRKAKRRKIREVLEPNLPKRNAVPEYGVYRDFSTAPDNLLTNGIFPDEIRRKAKLRDDLASQLDRIKRDISQLEYEARRSEGNHSLPPPSDEYIKRLKALLTTSNLSCTPPQPQCRISPLISSCLSFLLPFSVSRPIPRVNRDAPASSPVTKSVVHDGPSGRLSFLALFTPLTLLEHTTTLASSSNNLNSLRTNSSFVRCHVLTLSSPCDFPPQTYQIQVIVHTDPESHSVISISVADSPSNSFETRIPSIPAPLRTWISSRLSNPLLNRDVPGLCWGICRYWEAAMSRANAWAQLDNLLSRLCQETLPPQAIMLSRLEEATPRRLVPHFDRSSFLFSLQGRSNRPKLLITCSLTLDVWTGEPKMHPGICVIGTGVDNSDLEPEVRQVFWNVIKHPSDFDSDRLLSATEAVLRMFYENNKRDDMSAE
ncbi:hypothetical protein VTO42DRAFT_2644 [Malbranchea cinnamomea]